MHESVVFKRLTFLLKEKRSQHSTSCGNMNLDSWTAWEEEREGLTRLGTLWPSVTFSGSCQTLLAKSLHPQFLDNDIFLQTGRVLSLSTLFFSLSHLCPATGGLPPWLKELLTPSSTEYFSLLRLAFSTNFFLNYYHIKIILNFTGSYIHKLCNHSYAGTF